MAQILLQTQLLLTAVNALLPLLPAERRDRASEILNTVGQVLAAASAVGAHAEDFARHLTAIRGEVEQLAAAGAPVPAEAFDVALARVRTASAAFRAALKDAETG